MNEELLEVQVLNQKSHYVLIVIRYILYTLKMNYYIFLPSRKIFLIGFMYSPFKKIIMQLYKKFLIQNL
jgi:hypothetical protein